MHRVGILTISLILGACDGSNLAGDETPPDMAPGGTGIGGSDGSAGGHACVPAEDLWEEDIRPIFERYCNDCHGESLTAGAPYSLTAYDMLLADDGDGRVLDAVARSLASGTMPPAGQARLRSAERSRVIEWATCGAGMDTHGPDVNPGGDFDVDRQILPESLGAPDGTDFFELRADNFRMPADQTDRYECFTFELPIAEDRYMRRIETIVGDARVLHHIIVLPESPSEAGTHRRCGQENPLSLVYGWAPGQGALEFESGGIRIRPGQKLLLQIHYNNRAGHTDVADTSGIRIYHAPPEGDEVSMLTLGPLGFEIPPMQTSVATGWCQLTNDMRMIASFPHMHELGTAITSQFVHPDGTEESIVTLDGWDFNSQYIYETPVEFAEGDVIRTSCRFRNPTTEAVGFGPNTSDEMCFNFTYVTPPPDVTYCNQNQPPLGPTYEPGECAPAGAENAEAVLIASGIVEGDAPPLRGGDIPEGLWQVTEAEIFIPPIDLAQFEIDYLSSRVSGFGVFSFGDNRLHVDVTAQMHIVLSGLAFDNVEKFSFSGAYTRNPETPERLEISVDCGDVPNADGLVSFEYVDGAASLLLPVNLGPIQIQLLVSGVPALAQ